MVTPRDGRRRHLQGRLLGLVLPRRQRVQDRAPSSSTAAAPTTPRSSCSGWRRRTGSSALSAYQERLEQLYRDNPTFCEPEHFRNEVLGWLREGLRDFSISRAGAQWGIPFPDDPEPPDLRLVRRADELHHRRRLSGRHGGIRKWWPADVHVIGKNITRFHCLYWPAMLMSAGLPLPRQVFAHGFMLDQAPR